MTLRQLLTDRYAPVKGLSDRTVAIYSSTIDRFRDYLRREPEVADLEEDAIASFLSWRAKTVHSVTRGLPSPGTIAKDRTQLLCLALYAFRKRMIPEFPIVKPVRKSQRLPRGFTAPEVARLIVAARKRERTLSGLPAGWWWSTLIYAAWCSGARIGELLALRWSEVRGQEIVFLAGTRKGHTRDIARRITPDLATELEQFRRGPDDLVWPWPHRPTSIYASLRILCDQANVPQRRFHAIRKASASYVAAAGGDAVSHLDHSDANITRDHYLDDRIVGKASGVDFLPALDLGEEAEFVPDEVGPGGPVG
jgi:integrase